MERYIGLDVHAASSTLAVISQSGRRLQTAVVETHGGALVEAIRMIPGHKYLCFEEGAQSAWLTEMSVLRTRPPVRSTSWTEPESTLRRIRPDVPVMKTTYAGQTDDAGGKRGPGVGWTALR